MGAKENDYTKNRFGENMKAYICDNIRCRKCLTTMYVHLDLDKRYISCNNTHCSAKHIRFQIPMIELGEIKRLENNPELDKLYQEIKLLEKEKPSKEIYVNLRTLVQACAWSEESYNIVKIAIKLLEDHCMTEEKSWI